MYLDRETVQCEIKSLRLVNQTQTINYRKRWLTTCSDIIMRMYNSAQNSIPRLALINVRVIQLYIIISSIITV